MQFLVDSVTPQLRVATQHVCPPCLCATCVVCAHTQAWVRSACVARPRVVGGCAAPRSQVELRLQSASFYSSSSCIQLPTHAPRTPTPRHAHHSHSHVVIQAVQRRALATLFAGHPRGLQRLQAYGTGVQWLCRGAPVLGMQQLVHASRHGPLVLMVHVEGVDLDPSIKRTSNTTSKAVGAGGAASTTARPSPIRPAPVPSQGTGSKASPPGPGPASTVKSNSNNSDNNSRDGSKVSASSSGGSGGSTNAAAAVNYSGVELMAKPALAGEQHQHQHQHQQHQHPPLPTRCLELDYVARVGDWYCPSYVCLHRNTVAPVDTLADFAALALGPGKDPWSSLVWPACAGYIQCLACSRVRTWTCDRPGCGANNPIVLSKHGRWYPSVQCLVCRAWVGVEEGGVRPAPVAALFTFLRDNSIVEAPLVLAPVLPSACDSPCALDAGCLMRGGGGGRSLVQPATSSRLRIPQTAGGVESKEGEQDREQDQDQDWVGRAHGSMGGGVRGDVKGTWGRGGGSGLGPETPVGSAGAEAAAGPPGTKAPLLPQYQFKVLPDDCDKVR